jgi:uncharacterized protein (DUF2147 family)
MRIIIGRFEWWFKQCDESNVNRGVRSLRFRQRVIKERRARWFVDELPQLRFSPGFIGQLCNRRRVVYGPPRLTGNNEAAMKNYRKAALALWLATIASCGGSWLIGPALAADPTGTWYTGDKDSQVRLTNCGGALCGTLVWLKEPNDPATGRPKTDKNNADASKQSRPLLGVQIVLGMRPSGTPNQWSGSVYNASDGKTYSGSFTLTDANSAELKGCVLSVLCKSQTWMRAK